MLDRNKREIKEKDFVAVIYDNYFKIGYISKIFPESDLAKISIASENYIYARSAVIEKLPTDLKKQKSKIMLLKLEN